MAAYYWVYTAKKCISSSFYQERADAPEWLDVRRIRQSHDAHMYWTHGRGWGLWGSCQKASCGLTADLTQHLPVPVIRIRGLMRTQYFGIRTPLELENDCDQQHAEHWSAQPRPYLSPLIAPSLRLRPGHPVQPSWHRCIATIDNVNLKHMANLFADRGNVDARKWPHVAAMLNGRHTAGSVI